MDIDELSEPISSRSTPAKHGSAGGRIPLSPSKFKTRNSKHPIPVRIDQADLVQARIVSRTQHLKHLAIEMRYQNRFQLPPDTAS
jgi:hypothetical protein